jgi:hypothetical protein
MQGKSFGPSNTDSKTDKSKSKPPTVKESITNDL